MSPTNFFRTEVTNLVHEVVMPLIAVRDRREEYVSGSAFLIGRGWAVTAYHVVEDFLVRYGGTRAESGEVDMSFEILAYLTLDGGTKTLPLKVLRAWRAAPIDMAVLAIGVPEDWPKDRTWKVPAMDLLPPHVGTPIVGFGFANGKVERVSHDEPPTLSIDPVTTTGEVIEVHHKIRDTARLPFPCFRTNARFDGGMSGGLVFNNLSGRVCGVICSSITATRDDEEHVSYASSLWPLVATLVDASNTTPSGAAPYPLMKLFQNGTLRADNLDRVRIVREPNGMLSAEANYPADQWDALPSAKGADQS